MDSVSSHPPHPAGPANTKTANEAHTLLALLSRIQDGIEELEGLALDIERVVIGYDRKEGVDPEVMPDEPLGLLPGASFRTGQHQQSIDRVRVVLQSILHDVRP